MNFLTFWRGVKAGVKNFFRNGWLSVATISIIVLTLFLINIVFLITVVSNKTLENVQDKIDVSLYLKAESEEREIKSLEETIKKIEGVKETRYISKEEALADFKEKHKNDEVILKSIEELGNPLQPSFSIKINNPEDYNPVFIKIKENDVKGIISDVDYYSEKKPIVEKLSEITRSIRKVGIVIVLIFAAIAVLVTFNSVRLTMHNYRREVEIMKLVGAGHWFIRLPFIVEGMLYGFFSAWISILIFYPLIYFISPYLNKAIEVMDIVEYLNSNALKIIAIQLLSGIFLGAFSSLIAIRKYLKI